MWKIEIYSLWTNEVVPFNKCINFKIIQSIDEQKTCVDKLKSQNYERYL
jgi:hypothetical protein